MPQTNTHSKSTPTPFTETLERLAPGACVLRRELVEKLGALEEEAKSNHLQSPVRNLALHISGLMQQGRTDVAGLAGLARLLTANAFRYRALKLGEYIGECSGPENEKILHTLFQAQTRDEAGDPAPFSVFRQKVEREIIGIVITAHPTFAISKDLTRVLAELAVGGGGSKDSPGGESQPDLDDLVRQVTESRHGSPGAITLDDEMDFAMMAIGNIRGALRRVYRVVFAVARNAYPADWQRLKPKILSLASWVGYDLDGRSDIGWADTLKKRLAVERRALEEYRQALAGEDTLADVRDDLDKTITLLDGDMARLGENPDNAEAVGVFSRALVESLGTRLVDLGRIIDRLSEEIDRAGEIEKVGKNEKTSEYTVSRAVSLAVLRAEMATFGLAFAHTHVRINATQVTNAIRHDIELSSPPEDPANRRRYLREISELLDTVQPLTINFGSVMRERTSAKRLMMVVTQFYF